MKSKFIDVHISELFDVKSGDFHSVEELDSGNVPLISCGTTDNGFIGYFSIPENKTYSRAITVAYNGVPLTTKFHPYKFGAKDDIAVLIPRMNMKDSTLFYIAALIQMLKWRYNYGRKCYREKLKRVSITVPFTNIDQFLIDETEIERIFSNKIGSYIPPKNTSTIEYPKSVKWEKFIITDIFDLKRGDFHSIDALSKGDCLTVSRVSNNNGVVGYYERPQRAKLYDRGKITISTVGGDAFVQLDSFIATDNVIICSPKRKWRDSSLFFMCFMLNQQKWRYSYGRQCYKEKLSKVNFDLPVNDMYEPDEFVMGNFIESSEYWYLINKRFSD